MTVCDILKLGRLELITKTKDVSFPLKDETIKEINDMKDTLLSIPNSSGLAANQIGINKQIIVYHQLCKERVNEPVVIINPKIDLCSKEKEDGWEGCLSIPLLCALVPRYRTIYFSGYDEYGVLHEKHVTTIEARHLQHKIDYLNGITIFSRIKDKKMISFKSVLESGILNSSKVVSNSCEKY